MKIDVSYEALLRALVDAIRDERDHGTAMMSLVSRLVEEAYQQDWFEAHWRTDARLKLAQMACGHMPKGWRSAMPVLEVIAEAARQALKADEVDNESRATLLAIMRLADLERSTRATVEPKPRPAAKYARRGKANGAGSGRRAHTAAQLAKPASPQAIAIATTRPVAAKSAPTRKAKRSNSATRSSTTAKRFKRVSRSHTPAQLAKAAASPQAVAVAKARPATAKATQVRKAKRSRPTSRSHTAAQLAKPAAPPKRAPVAKAPLPVKAAPARKTKRSKPMSRTHVPAQLAKPAAAPKPAPVVKAAPPAKAAPARKPNGAGQASSAKLGAPAIVT